jgi:hypothetical protein
VKTSSLDGGKRATVRNTACTASRVRYLDTPGQEKKVGTATSTPDPGQLVEQWLGFEVHGREGQVVRRCDGDVGKASTLIPLAGRLVHLDDPQSPRPAGPAVAEGVEVGTPGAFDPGRADDKGVNAGVVEGDPVEAGEGGHLGLEQVAVAAIGQHLGGTGVVDVTDIQW